MNLPSQLQIGGKLLTANLKQAWRDKTDWITACMFAITALLLYSFAFNLTTGLVSSLLPGVIWTVFLFSGIFATGQSFQQDRQNGILDALKISPIHSMTIYIAKTLANILMLLLIEFGLLLGATILFSEPLFTPELLIIVTIGTIGYTALSTLLSAINLDRNNGGLLLPVLALPLLVPLLIASVEATSASLQQEASTTPWILLLSLFTIWSTAIATLMFPLAD
ncbi:MAG: hypothetical protein CL718_03660 [Chloroflexi bacterium]|nr:hypothetical protein [Chloroflexota bacterium]|tara:strand:- start:153 stop:821 length:669 start_codon:yes stop_codon:yes gene_type:complete